VSKKKLKAYLLASSNSFQNLTPKREGNFTSEILNYFYKLKPLIYFLSLSYICIRNPIILLILSLSSHLRIGNIRVYISARRGRFFKCGKIGSWDKELLESSFFNLTKKIRLGSSFGNYWISKSTQNTLPILWFLARLKKYISNNFQSVTPMNI
jgi:hypothetical protein